MRDQKLYESVGKYIDKYYIDKPDDIKLDKEMKSIFDRISEFRKKKATKKCDAEEDTDIEIDESAVESFDVESMQKTKATDSMSSTLATNRNIESLIGQMDETFSQRLLRLIDERGMTDSEAYNKAYVDRRHFSKIRKDVNYTPNKKTVLAFAIALELSIDEAKDLLNSAGFAFSRSSKTDIIVAYFLQNKIYDMFEIKGAVGYLMGKEPNQVTRLINVAITRGKGKVIVVANARFWENIFKGRNHVFYRLLQHIKNKNHQVVEYQDKTLQPYVESINPGKVVDIFVDEQDAIAKFEQDMLKAKWKVVISLPSGELRETENQIFKLIDDADSRGVDILMKSNDYASLPQHWKNYCRGTENATFPLIIIDDEVAWYGLPTANWKFDVDKTTSLKTVVYMMVRFKGKNTVEMLKALTDIEAVAIGVNTKKLLKKDNNMVTHPMASSSGAVVPDDGKSAYGLAGFVEEKEFCPACKSHMVLTKNARGTAYLKCSNKACKETKYLTVDLMNWYISSHNVGCPKHDGGELKGRLGKYGPYVTCTCGHTLKPHDI